MLNLLAKWFIPNYSDTKNPTVRSAYGTLSSIVGILFNLLLSALKLIVGLLANSVAAIADAFNNFSDAGSALVSLISFRISAKPADRSHPFGHARIEYVASMIVSFLILGVGFSLLSDSFMGLLGKGDTEGAEFGLITLILLGCSILFKLILALFYRSVGNKIESSVMKASMMDSLMDCISTGAVLLCGIVIRFTSWVFLDSLVGIAVSILILFSGIKILNDTKNSILGEAPVDEIVDSILEIVNRYPEALGVHDMLVHNYGPSHYIASLHVEVDGEQDIFELHDTIDLIEKNIHDELNILCTIHMDPIVTNDQAVSSLREFVVKTVSEIDATLSIHDFRTVIGKTHTNLIFDLVLPFESKFSEEEINELVCARILEQRPNHYCVITIDRG